MLLLLTIALVLIGAVALVIGFVGGSQLPIFISIACSVLAGLVLVIFSRMSRRQPTAVPAGGPAPIGEAVSERPATALVDDTAVHDAVMDDEEEEVEEEERVPARAAAGDGGGWSGDDFPIEEYDELLVSEILPLLPELDADELEQVREREQQGKARATLLRRIDQLGEEVGGGVAVATAERPRSTFERPPLDDEPEDEDEEEEEDDEELAPVSAGGDDDVLFPIEDYDDLRVSEILPLLPELYDDELDMVADRERQGANRATILNRIDELLNEGEAPPPPPPKKATPKRAAPKKTAAKKTAARKAAPAKKATAKKAAAAKKTTAKKATTAKKTTAKKATAKKATAKKAATRRR